jgi:putative transposase
VANSPKKYSNHSKVKVALEAIKRLKTLNEISSEYGVHTTQITQWKKQVLDELPQIFARPGVSANQERGSAHRHLVSTNRPTQSRTGLSQKKQTPISTEQKRLQVEPTHPHLSIIGSW